MTKQEIIIIILLAGHVVSAIMWLYVYSLYVHWRLKYGILLNDYDQLNRKLLYKQLNERANESGQKSPQ